MTSEGRLLSPQSQPEISLRWLGSWQVGVETTVCGVSSTAPVLQVSSLCIPATCSWPLLACVL